MERDVALTSLPAGLIRVLNNGLRAEQVLEVWLAVQHTLVALVRFQSGTRIRKHLKTQNNLLA